MDSDYSDCLALQRKLSECADKLTKMAGEVGMARQIREFNSDQRKGVLAIAALPFLKSGTSAAAADTEARASNGYCNSMKRLKQELLLAEQIIAKWEAEKIVWESCRSLLSMQKETIRQLQVA